MKYMQAILAVVGVFVIGGAIDSVRAQSPRAALYTSALRATLFNCNAVNVSHKTLNINISMIDLDGDPLSVSDPITTAPGVEASSDFGTLTNPIDAHCKFEAFPTGNRNDLRVVLVASLVRTFAEGDQTNIPAFVARTVEGY